MNSSTVSSFAAMHPAEHRTMMQPLSIIRSVLIVDDDVALSSMIREYLERYDIQLEHCQNGELGLEAAASGNYDMVLLDVMLPDLSGFEVLARLRMQSNLPVMLLSARGQSADRIRGLKLGADDYLAKPFDPEELVARIHAVIRRANSSMQPPWKEEVVHTRTVDGRIRLGDFLLDMSSRWVWYRATKLALTEIEFALLRRFMLSPDVALKREELVLEIFGRPFHPLNRNLDMHVSRLRKKLDAASMPVNPIRTVRSSGYLFSTTDM